MTIACPFGLSCLVRYFVWDTGGLKRRFRAGHPHCRWWMWSQRLVMVANNDLIDSKMITRIEIVQKDLTLLFDTLLLFWLDRIWFSWTVISFLILFGKSGNEHTSENNFHIGYFLYDFTGEDHTSDFCLARGLWTWLIGSVEFCSTDGDRLEGFCFEMVPIYQPKHELVLFAHELTNEKGKHPQHLLARPESIITNLQ